MSVWPRHDGDLPFKEERVDRLTARRSDQCWEISIEPVSKRSDESPRPTLDPVVAAFADRLRGVTMDDAGEVVSLQLADGPETEATHVREVAGAPVLDRVLAEMWRRRGAGLAGHEAAPGTIWNASAKVSLPSGESITYKTSWSVGDAVRCGPASCVRVNVQWSANLTPLFMAMQYDAASRWAGPGVNPNGLQRWYVKGKGQLTVQPAGLRLHRMRTEEKLSLSNATAPEKDVFREIVETRELVAAPETDQN